MAVYRHEVPGNRRKIKRLRYDGKYDTSHASTCRAISFWACAKSQAVLAYLVLQLLFAAELGRRKTRCASVPYYCGQPLAVLFHTLFPRPSLVPSPRPAFRRLQYVLIATESWAGPGNEAIRDPLTPVCRGAQLPASSVQGGCSPPRPPPPLPTPVLIVKDMHILVPRYF